MFDEGDDEPSRFERENLEKSREQQRVKQNCESNQQHQTSRHISSISCMSSGYSQQREEGNMAVSRQMISALAPMMVSLKNILIKDRSYQRMNVKMLNTLIV